LIRTLESLGLAWDIKQARLRQPTSLDESDSPAAGEAVA
jgi:hypothetical protein